MKLSREILLILLTQCLCIIACDLDNELKLSDEQKVKFQKVLLNLLGIPTGPRTVPRKSMGTESSQFLLDAFRFIDVSNNRVKRYTNNLREEDITKIQKSDMIVTLHNTNKREHRIGNTNRIYFSMPKLPEIHKINGAELKVYQDAKVNKLPFLKLSVAVYRLVKTFLGIPELEKISENITTKDYTGWLTFDISKAFTSWVSQAAHAFKLYISVHPVGTDKALPSSYIGIDFRTTNRPYVVAFLKTNEKIATRLPRSISPEYSVFPNHIEGEACKLKTLKITFKELHWDDWVIAPETYISAFCQGGCKFPLKLPINATNHAIIQSLIHVKMNSKYPEPTCAPTVLNPLTILYQDQNNVVLRTYEDMIAGNCNTNRIYFSMPKLPEIHKINGAELKVYQDAKVNKLPFLKLSVAVYRLVKTFLGIPELEKISENITTKDYTGWLTFDISKAFTSWVSQAAHAFKLYISVHPVGTDKALPSSYIGIDFRTTNRPYVVAFLKTNEKIATRLPRSISPEYSVFPNHIEGEACKLKTLKITFKELHWDDWVIAPETYISAFCQGGCKFPLKLPINATNHAIIQSLIHVKMNSKYPEPTCAPTVLNPLTILYQDQNNVVLRTYEDMIAGNCGCH